MMAMVTVLAGAEASSSRCSTRPCAAGWSAPGHDPALAADALARLPSMPAYPDVPDALAALRSGGFQLAVLTQSAVDAAETVLSNAGIRDHFELVLSAPDSGAFKPEDLAYRYALEQAGATDAWFVAGHWWDVAGAAYAGLRTAWISRTDLAYPIAMPPPDVRGADLAEVAEAYSEVALVVPGLQRPAVEVDAVDDVVLAALEDRDPGVRMRDPEQRREMVRGELVAEDRAAEEEVHEAPVRDAQHGVVARGQPLLHAVDAAPGSCRTTPRPGRAKSRSAVGIHVIEPVSPYSGADV